MFWPFLSPDSDTEDPWIRIRFRIRNTGFMLLTQQGKQIESGSDKMSCIIRICILIGISPELAGCCGEQAVCAKQGDGWWVPPRPGDSGEDQGRSAQPAPQTLSHPAWRCARPRLAAPLRSQGSSNWSSRGDQMGNIVYFCRDSGSVAETPLFSAVPGFRDSTTCVGSGSKYENLSVWALKNINKKIWIVFVFIHASCLFQIKALIFLLS